MTVYAITDTKKGRTGIAHILIFKLPESVLWDTTKNSSEEDKELAWKRLSELFGTPIG